MLTIPRHFPIRKTPKRYKPAVNNPNIIPAPTLAAICTVKKKDSRNFFSQKITLRDDYEKTQLCLQRYFYQRRLQNPVKHRR